MTDRPATVKTFLHLDHRSTSGSRRSIVTSWSLRSRAADGSGVRRLRRPLAVVGRQRDAPDPRPDRGARPSQPGRPDPRARPREEHRAPDLRRARRAGVGGARRRRPLRPRDPRAPARLDTDGASDRDGLPDRRCRRSSTSSTRRSRSRSSTATSPSTSRSRRHHSRCATSRTSARRPRRSPRRAAASCSRASRRRPSTALFAGRPLITPTGRRLGGMAELRTILDDVRRNGVAENWDETARGLYAASVPIDERRRHDAGGPDDARSALARHARAPRDDRRLPPGARQCSRSSSAGCPRTRRARRPRLSLGTQRHASCRIWYNIPLR